MGKTAFQNLKDDMKVEEEEEEEEKEEVLQSAFPYHKDLLFGMDHNDKIPCDRNDKSIEFICDNLDCHGFGYLLHDPPMTLPTTMSTHTKPPKQDLANQNEYQCAFQILCHDSPITSLDIPSINHIKTTLYPKPYPHHTPSSTNYHTHSQKHTQQNKALSNTNNYLLSSTL
jgi:hypothetical protein